MRLKKRAQLAMFIVFGIILVVAIGLLFFLTGPIDFGKSDNVFLQDFVEGCLESTLEDGLELIGRQGGYYKFSGESYIEYSGDDGQPGPLRTDLKNIKVPFYFDNFDLKVPSQEFIEGQISLYVEENLDSCLKGLKEFERRGYSRDVGNIKANTSLLDESVRVYIEYPITISKGDSIETISIYSKELPIRLRQIYDFSLAIFLQQSLDFTQLCLNCISQNSRERGYYVQMIVYDSNSIIFVITDTERKLKGEHYDFIYAYRPGEF